MIIKSLQVHNFRSFNDTKVFEFATDSKKNTTFIWADNNVGKTNILNAITWCFHRKFTSSFKGTDDLLNHQAKADGEKEFYVIIIFEESGKTYSIKRTSGVSSDAILHEMLSDGDYKVVHNESYFINSILPKEMMDYFFIDGEGISASVNDKGEILAAQSVKDILGFQVALHTIQDLEKIRKEHSALLKKLDVSSELTNSQDKYDRYEDEIFDKSKKLKDLEEVILKYENDFKRADSFLKSLNHEVVKINVKNREALKNDLDFSLARMRDLENNKIKLIRKYYTVAFSKNLSNKAMGFIDENQFKGTLPAPFNESLIFKIINEAQCICGAEVKPGTTAYEKIYEMLREASNPDVLDRIIRARSQLEVIKNYSADAIVEIKNNYIEIDNLNNKIKSIRDKIDNISEQLKNISDDLISENEKLRSVSFKNITSTSGLIHLYKSDISKLKELSEKISVEIKKLAGFSPKATLLKDKIDFISSVKSSIENDLEVTYEKSKSKIADEMNKFMHKHLIQDLKVKIKDDYRIGLYSANDVLVAPGGGLTAMLSLVYTSILINLARERRNAQGNILTPGAIAPVILDAPFSKLSETYAPKLAAALPENAEQLIIFMYDGNAKGGEIAIRENGRLGKEYYLVQEMVSEQYDKPLRSIIIEGEKYALNEYNKNKDTVSVREVLVNGY